MYLLLPKYNDNYLLFLSDEIDHTLLNKNFIPITSSYTKVK